MSIFISIVIFALGLFLFFITNNKLKKIKDNLLIDDTRKEIESLITEFNSAAARNIELLESKISDLQEMINKANNKMNHLDDKIDRANRPFVVERMVDKTVSAPSAFQRPEESIPAIREEKKSEPVQFNRKSTPVKSKVIAKELPSRSAKPDKKQTVAINKGPVKTVAEKKSFAEEMSGPSPVLKASPSEPLTRNEPLTRHEQLKQHIQDGLSKQELIALGFMENEINLLNFLIKKKV